MTNHLKLTLAQLNLPVGDIEGNTERLLQIAREASFDTDLVLFPELSLTGYPPEDLLLRADLYERVAQSLDYILAQDLDVALLIGHPWREDGRCFNAVSFIYKGKILGRYYKQKLPNYGVFDEQRYFYPGTQACVVEFKQHRLGLLICEDLWSMQPAMQAKQAGAQLLIAVNASPFDKDKPGLRQSLLAQRCRETELALVYLNTVGGQDELVFDGFSKVFHPKGDIVQRLPGFEESIADCTMINGIPQCTDNIAHPMPVLQAVYQALVLAVRDYVAKNGFCGVVLGLSGGIDSALTLAIAVDALGPERVQAVMMPFRYTSSMSIEDAMTQANTLGANYQVISIEPIFEACMQQLQPILVPQEGAKTQENLQARCRGILLMALSNQHNHLVLTTGNKSEMAVGYATLYGDMAGGFAVLKDVSKTLVYALARYRNQLSAVIPQRVIDRPPSAELAPDQVDQDSLPPYEILDPIIEMYVEQDAMVSEIVAKGYDEAVVKQVIRLIDINEYKRRQAAVGPRISPRNFGRDRRYPITSRFGSLNW